MGEEKRGLRVLFVDDLFEECEPLIQVLEGRTSPYKLDAKDNAKNTKEVFERLEQEVYDLIILDINFGEGAEREGLAILRKIRASEKYSHYPVVVFTNVHDAGCQEDFLGEGVDGFMAKQKDALGSRIASVRHVIEKSLKMGELRRQHLRTKGLLLGSSKKDDSVDILGIAPSMRAIFHQLLLVAADQSCPNVLILGDPGSGKSVMARALHLMGGRREYPFIEVVLNTIAESLLESILFGGEKIATDVPKRKGLIEECNGGTLFLDEIGDLPGHLQVKLLQVLRDKKIRPLGKKELIDIDFQLICATNRDLETLVRNRVFRPDLYHRISGVQIEIPPLRKRFHECPLELDSMLDLYMQHSLESTTPFTFSFTDEAKALLRNHEWPGNYAELVTLLRELSILSCTFVDSRMVEKRLLQVEYFRELPRELQRCLYVFNIDKYEAATKEFQKTYINYWLDQFGGNIARTSKQIEVDATTIYRKLHPEKGKGKGEVKES